MIHITDKKDCCGCSACAQRCPKHCIAMREDEEGFIYPEVDAAACIGCGLCERVCPLINSREAWPVVECVAAKNRDDGERMAASSGGVFIALARKVIDEGGIVFGVVFDEAWETMHAGAETMAEVQRMVGSKYVQSRIGTTYAEAEKWLKQGRRVMFTGTPCQIAGLHGFLRSDYPNLLTVEVLCHGAPSPGVWRRYLAENIGLTGSGKTAGEDKEPTATANAGPVITSVVFRDKHTSGWRRRRIVIRGTTPETEEETELLSCESWDSLYIRGFLTSIFLRPSCYRCRVKNGKSHSDLTIGDFWGIGKVMPDFSDDIGVSIVIAGSEKGKAAFAALDMDTRPARVADAARFNGGFDERQAIPPKRKEFFRRLNDGTTVNDGVEFALHKPQWQCTADDMRMAARQFLRRLLLRK